MKNIFIAIITFYQRFISPVFHQLLGVKTGCKYHPTCSVYAQNVIDTYGVGKGTLFSLRRLATCQPFFNL